MTPNRIASCVRLPLSALLLFFIALPFSVATALAQAVSGTIVGTVTVCSGALGERIGLAPHRFSLEVFAAEWANFYGIDSICMTLGEAGCFVYADGNTFTVPGFPAEVEDTVGAGDACAAAFLHGYHLRWAVLQTARFADAVGSVVASRAGATPPWSVEECCARASIPTEEVYATHA